MSLSSRERAIRDRYLAYLRSRKFNPILKRFRRPPVGRYVIAFLALMTTIGIPITIYQLVRIFRSHGDLRKSWIALVERSIPITTLPLMFNSSLGRQPGMNAPALVIGSFEHDLRHDSELLNEIVERVYLIELEGAKDDDERAIERLMADEEFQPGRRRLLPDRLTDGHQVYAFDLPVIGDFLPAGWRDHPLIPCMVEPGPEGQLLPIPWWVAEEAERLSEDRAG